VKGGVRERDRGVFSPLFFKTSAAYMPLNIVYVFVYALLCTYLYMCLIFYTVVNVNSNLWPMAIIAKLFHCFFFSRKMENILLRVFVSVVLSMRLRCTSQSHGMVDAMDGH